MSLATAVLEISDGYIILGAAVTYTERQIALTKIDFKGDTRNMKLISPPQVSLIFADLPPLLREKK